MENPTVKLVEVVIPSSQPGLLLDLMWSTVVAAKSTIRRNDSISSSYVVCQPVQAEVRKTFMSRQQLFARLKTALCMWLVDLVDDSLESMASSMA